MSAACGVKVAHFWRGVLVRRRLMGHHGDAPREGQVWEDNYVKETIECCSHATVTGRG
jgi:hypothetical protein